MSNQDKISVRFSSDQLIGDDVQFPPKIRQSIVDLAENNIESLSATVKRICQKMVCKSDKDIFHLRRKVLEYAVKNNFENKADAIKDLCRKYFELENTKPNQDGFNKKITWG
jgi:hypothetical protein